MKFFKKMKDGGAESTVTGYWLCEFKSLFSIVLLKFEGNSREAYHTHAFNCWNWLIKGRLGEFFKWEGPKEPIGYENGVPHYLSWGKAPNLYLPSWKPFFIGRDRFHKVDSITPTSWVLSFRGPWSKTWKEYLPNENRERTLTHGRKEV